MSRGDATLSNTPLQQVISLPSIIFQGHAEGFGGEVDGDFGGLGGLVERETVGEQRPDAHFTSGLEFQEGLQVALLVPGHEARRVVCLAAQVVPLAAAGAAAVYPMNV